MNAVSDRVHRLQSLASAVRALIAAQVASERAAGKRAAIGPGASRAAMTTANARWSTAAEDRDRQESEVMAALVECGFATAEESSVVRVAQLSERERTCKEGLQVGGEP